jgi:hypothetical protein
MFGSATASFWFPVILFLQQDTFFVVLQIVAVIGWVPIMYLIFLAGFHMWKEYKEEHAKASWKWVLLAIDVPQLNIQTPRAVEQMFAHLAGAYDKVNIAQKFWHGYKQRFFSFEIVSIEGYIQFLVRTEVALRDLVESAVYAQYPDAEIVEVHDYIDTVPTVYPNDTHDIWAADFGLAEDDAFPLRTYEAFEHSISRDETLKDPMGTFLESFTRLGTGEQMWFQILIEPASNEWKEKALAKVQEIIGDKTGKHAPHGSVFADSLVKGSMRTLEAVGDELFNREAGGHEEVRAANRPNDVTYLTPGQKKILEKIEDKIAKIGFKSKIRAVYVAKKDVYNPFRGVQALQGAINQFNVPSANSLVPKYQMQAWYFLKHWRMGKRKTLLMKSYKKRKIKAGANPCILNIEELATIWHFPMSHVKTPMIVKASDKRGEPPASLPMQSPDIQLPFAPKPHVKPDG